MWQNYLKWNEALFDNFFVENNSINKEIFLYVNNEIINEIGHIYGLGTYEDFLQCVLLSNDDRRALYKYLWNRITAHKTTLPENRILNGNSIYAFAELIATQFPKCNNFYFNYIVLAINVMHESQVSGKNFIESMKSTTCAHFHDTYRYNTLDSLFEHLKKYVCFNYNFLCFNDYRLTRQRYIGLLKYQLIFKNTEVKEIEQTIYKNGLFFEDQERYEQKIYRLIDYIPTDTLRLKIKDSVNGDNELYRKRISDIITNFNPEEYCVKHGDEERRFIGDFALAIHFGNYDNRLVLLSNVRSNNKISQDKLEIKPCSMDTIGIYNKEHVLINGDDQASMTTYNLDNKKYSIKSVRSNRDIIFFEKFSTNYYVQTLFPKGKECYIATRPISRTQDWVNINCYQAKRIDQKYSDSLLGTEWLLYHTTRVEKNLGNGALISANGNEVKINELWVEQIGGILVPKMKNVYFVTALPYYQFLDDIYLFSEELKINIFDEDDKELKFDKFIQEQNLIVQLTDYDSKVERSQLINVTIKYNHKHASFSYSIRDQDVKYDVNILYKYNRWGDIAHKGDKTYFSGTKAFGVEACIYEGNMPIIQIPTFRFDYKPFYFINLLATIAFSNKSFGNEDLKKCIRYSALKMNIDVSSDRFWSNLRNLLVNGGYICANYEGTSTYQAVPPTFIRSGRSFRGDSGNAWMLVGCYTLSFLDKLCQFCQNKHIIIQYIKQEEMRKYHPLSLLPPILLLDYNFNVEKFINETGMVCETCDNHDVAMEIMSMMPMLTEYSTTLTKEPKDSFNGRILEYDRETPPRVGQTRGITGKRTAWLDCGEDNYEYSSVKDHAWIYLYESLLKKEPFFWVDQYENGKIYFLLTQHLPFLLQRALQLLNRSQPTIEKIFITDGKIGDNKLYHNFKVYKVDAFRTTHRTLIAQILTGNFAVYQFAPQPCWKLELWTSKDPFKPSQWLVAKHQGVISAFANYKDGVYCRQDTNYYKVEGTLNAALSNILKYACTEQHLDLNFVAPEENKYNVEKILIK